jgi:IS30 family transposase
MIEYVEGKILGEEKWSPDAAIGYARENKRFEHTFCTRTFYNYVESGLSKVKAIDLLLKVRRTPASKPRERKKKLGRSIDERPQAVKECTEFGHRKEPLRGSADAHPLRAATGLQLTQNFTDTSQRGGKRENASNY